MSREDWTAVGVRLYGLYLTVGALFAIPNLVMWFAAARGPFLQSGATNAILQWAVGSFLLFRADWLAAKLGRRLA